MRKIYGGEMAENKKEIAGKRKQTPGGIGRNKTDFKPSNVKFRQEARLVENQKSLKNINVKAFISAIAAAEGGDYNLKYGGVIGKKNDKWKFSDFSSHPGPGSDGRTTAAGMYQINRATWQEMGKKMGLTDFSPSTQDLLAVEILRTIGAIDSIGAGDINSALSKASRRWAALPQGPGKTGRYPQPYMEYDDFVAVYKKNGGGIK
jgi:muramidase (phage lysozyme)